MLVTIGIESMIDILFAIFVFGVMVLSIRLSDKPRALELIVVTLALLVWVLK